MQCYKGGLAVQENFQMCDVTSESENNGSSGLGDALMRRSEDHRHDPGQQTASGDLHLFRLGRIVQLELGTWRTVVAAFTRGYARTRRRGGDGRVQVPVLGGPDREFLLQPGEMLLG